jgi:hypothetical protein
MGVPCMTLRNNTERPETIQIGANELLGTDPKVIKPALDNLTYPCIKLQGLFIKTLHSGWGKSILF